MIGLTGVGFRYPGADHEEAAGFELVCDRLALGAGSRTAVVGPSGSGKTTLLHLMAGILAADRGRVEIDGHAFDGMSDAARRRYRLRHVGMVFQSTELLEYLDVRDNILLPFRLGGGLVLDRAAREHATHLAERVGLADRLGSGIDALSHGERQRVTICRALVARPKLLLADEPTSALDADTARAAVDLMFDLTDRLGTTMVVLTHDAALLPRFDQIARVKAGVVDAGPADTAGAAGTPDARGGGR